MNGLEKRKRLHEGKAKIVWSTNDPDCLIIEYKDTATAFDGKKKGMIQGKGELNNLISALMFERLEAAGIATHYRGTLSPHEMVVLPLDIIKVEVVVRNIAAGSLCRRLGLAEGQALSRPLVEFYYKDDVLGDPLINDDHALILGLASGEELAVLRQQALAVNACLVPWLGGIGLELVDFKLEFGRHAGTVVLGDEISPDTCRFWDVSSREKLDKDRFRRDLGRVEEAYREVYARLRGQGG